MKAIACTRAGRALGLVLILTTALVIAAFVVVFALNRVGGADLAGVKTVVDIGGENNVPTWWNGALLFGVAAAAAIVAFAATPTRGERSTALTEQRAWLVIAAAAGYLTLDELAQLHERLNEPVRAAGLDLPTYAWLLPGVVIAAAGALVLARAARLLPPFTARRLGLALAVYLAGAIGMEAVNGLFSGRWLDLELIFAVGTTLEESLEMLACILALTAIVDHLAAPRPAAPATVLPPPRRPAATAALQER